VIGLRPLAVADAACNDAAMARRENQQVRSLTSYRLAGPPSAPPLGADEQLLERGDVLLFKGQMGCAGELAKVLDGCDFNHAAVYLGNGRVADRSDYHDDVGLCDGWFRKRYGALGDAYVRRMSDPKKCASLADAAESLIPQPGQPRYEQPYPVSRALISAPMLALRFGKDHAVLQVVFRTALEIAASQGAKALGGVTAGEATCAEAVCWAFDKADIGFDVPDRTTSPVPAHQIGSILNSVPCWQYLGQFFGRGLAHDLRSGNADKAAKRGARALFTSLSGHYFGRLGLHVSLLLGRKGLSKPEDNAATIRAALLADAGQPKRSSREWRTPYDLHHSSTFDENLDGLLVDWPDCCPPQPQGTSPTGGGQPVEASDNR
jgi:hypothetical protein